MSSVGEFAVFQGDMEVMELDSDDEEPAVIQRDTKKSLKKSDWPPCLNGYTKPSYTFPQLITKALALCPGRRATTHSLCDQIAVIEPYYKHFIGNWKELVHSSLLRNKSLFVISEKNRNSQPIWSFNPNFEKFMLHKWLPTQVQNKEKYVSPTIIDTIVESEISTSSPTVDPLNTRNLSVDGWDCLKKISHSNFGQFSSKNTTEFLNADSVQQSVNNGFQSNNRVPHLEQNVTCLFSKPGAETQDSIASSSGENVPEFVLADPDQLEDYQLDDLSESKNPLEIEVTASGK